MNEILNVIITCVYYGTMLTFWWLILREIFTKEFLEFCIEKSECKINHLKTKMSIKRYEIIDEIEKNMLSTRIGRKLYGKWRYSINKLNII